MFRKKQSWYWSAIKALVFTGFLYRCARSFMRLAEKQSRPPKKPKEKRIKF